MKKSTENSATYHQSNQGYERSVRCNGNLYILGRLGVAALKAIQITAQLCFIPTVKAAAPETDPPKKPPPMKYKDLPLYDCPHWKYKELNIVEPCPDHNVRILHQMLLPSVSEYRKEIGNTLHGIKSEIVDTCNELRTDYRTAETQFLNYMRNPENAPIPVIFMGAAALMGLRMGKTIPRRLFASGLALFISGSICFPEDTDEIARTLMYKIAKTFVPLYNCYSGTDWKLRERVPCPRDVPEIPSPPTKPFPGCVPVGKK